MGKEIRLKRCGRQIEGAEIQEDRRERKGGREEQEDDRVVWWFQRRHSRERFFSFSLSPGDHPMLSCLSFKRGRLCQSSQIRKTEVAERLYLAWVKRRAPGEVRIGEGPAEPLCIPTGSRSCCSGATVCWLHSKWDWMEAFCDDRLRWQQAGVQIGTLLTLQPAV